MVITAYSCSGKVKYLGNYRNVWITNTFSYIYFTIYLLLCINEERKIIVSRTVHVESEAITFIV